MHKKFVILILPMLFFYNINQVYAYSWKECKSKVVNVADPSGAPAFISSTQYISSFGPCSAFGKNKENKRKFFYAFNWEFIKKDIAKGGGEDLSSLLLMSNCKSSDAFNIRSNLKMKYSELFLNDMESSYHAVTDVIGKFCKMSS